MDFWKSQDFSDIKTMHIFLQQAPPQTFGVNVRFPVTDSLTQTWFQCTFSPSRLPYKYKYPVSLYICLQQAVLQRLDVHCSVFRLFCKYSISMYIFLSMSMFLKRFDINVHFSGTDCSEKTRFQCQCTFLTVKSSCISVTKYHIFQTYYTKHWTNYMHNIMFYLVKSIFNGNFIFVNKCAVFWRVVCAHMSRLKMLLLFKNDIFIYIYV